MISLSTQFITASRIQDIMNKWVLTAFLGSGSLLLLWQAQRVTRLGGGKGKPPIKKGKNEMTGHLVLEAELARPALRKPMEGAPCRTRKTDNNEEGETDEIPGITKRTGPPPEQVQQQGGAASHIQGEDEGNLVQPSQTEAASSFFQGISVIAKQIFNAIGKASDE
ncbi:unnamed protein product [Urochloa humidicola]